MLFIKFLKGEAKLWQAWWIFWVLIPFVLSMVSKIPADIHQKHPLTFSFIGIFSLVFPFLIVSSVWKCTKNCGSRGWTSIARILLVLSPFIVIARTTQDTHSNLNIDVFFSLSMLSSVLIIIIYLVGKIAKSEKIVTFNHYYVAPTLLTLAHFFLFMWGILYAFYFAIGG